MIATPSDFIGGVYTVPLRPLADDRGYFCETFRRATVPGGREMTQQNVSFSRAGVLRGMHYHLKQADFVLVPSGRVRAALFDLRTGSPTRGGRQVLEMGEGHPVGLYVPKGVAHGFHALTDALVIYLVDELYDGGDELGVRWDDPALGIDWGVRAPILSARDRGNPLLAAIPAGELPR
jgi:dTDP-4-dehydrorhamnose 3,5-epimerase